MDPDPSNSLFVIGAVIALVILLILSGFFSASETAFTSFNEIRMENLGKKKRRARLALKLKGNYDRLLSTILVGNNIVNISSSALATVLFTRFYNDMGPTIATIVVTIVVLIFGEIGPKTFAKQKAEGVAMAFVYPLYFFYYLFYPLTLLFQGISFFIKKIFKVKEDPAFTEEEFKMLVEDVHEDGVLNELEHDIIQNTIEYGDTHVEEIMKPAKEVTFVSIKDSNEQILKVFMDSNYSRIPVSTTHKVQNIFGVIHQRDFYEMLILKNSDLKSIIKEPIIVKPKKKISRLLKAFQKEHQHFAFVKDEGKLVGIITMENILEELVGEIKDEFDEEE